MTKIPTLSWLDFVAIAVAAVLYTFLRKRERAGARAALPDAQGAHRARSPDVAAVNRNGGLPDPDPLVDFDLRTARLRDYVYANKTMRYPYFQTMAHQPMHINHWIEIDSEFQWYLDEKARVIKEQGKTVLDSLPDNDDACGELLELLVDYLPKRYPTLFARIPPSAVSDKAGPGTGAGIWNKVTDERFPAVEDMSGVAALHIVARLVQDDFLMGREREDGKVYLVGGLLPFPGNYLLSEKIGKPIHLLHDVVPHFNDKLLLSVERTLARFRPDAPFERSSWMIVDDRHLFWHNIASHPVPETLHPGDLWLRIDHQTFRKLPRSGGIIFGVHPVQRRIRDLADSPLVPALVAKVHTESDAELLQYKITEKYAARLLPYLHELTAQQLARGLIRPEDLEEVAKFRDLRKAAEAVRPAR